MLKFYYHPLSPISRRVWWALLAKEIPFDPIVVDLRGKQYEPDFLAINPFHHVPVIEYEDVRLLESIAILDYLEQRFPQVPLCPSSGDASGDASGNSSGNSSAAALGQMKMVQMVVTNELLPKLVSVINAAQQPLSAAQKEHLETCLRFLNQQLGEQAYFGGDRLNLADIVAGSTVPLFSRLGLSLAPHSALQAWQQRIFENAAWQLTNPNEADFQQWKRWIQLQVKRRQRSRQKAAVS